MPLLKNCHVPSATNIKTVLGYSDVVQQVGRKHMEVDLEGSSCDFPRSRHPGARQAEQKRCRVCGRLGESAEGTRPLR